LKAGNYISLAATNTDITIDGSQNLTNMFNSKQDKITATGNDSINNFLLLDGALNLRSLQAGGYVQLVQNSTTLLITASSALQTALAGKQPSFTVSGDDVSSFRLLRSGYLASIGNSDTVTAQVTTNPDGTPLIKFNSTLNVGALTGYAPVADPSFTSTANFANVTTITGLTRIDGTIKDLGLSNAINLRLTPYALSQNPQFTGSASSPLFNATTSLTIQGNTVPTALQISNTLTSYLTSSGATFLYPD
jgi:hypothetical protein